MIQEITIPAGYYLLNVLAFDGQPINVVPEAVFLKNSQEPWDYLRGAYCTIENDTIKVSNVYSKDDVVLVLDNETAFMI